MPITRPIIRGAFSITELLVVVAIVTLIFALSCAAVQRIRAAADKMSCAANMRQVGIALHHYHLDYGRFPPKTFDAALADREVSWRGYLLPYLEQNALWAITERAQAIEPDPSRSPPHQAFAIVIRGFVCPADGRIFQPLVNGDGVVAAYGTYVGVTGGDGGRSDGVMTLPGARLADVRDGTSNTLMVGERPPPDDLHAGQWYPLYTRAARGLMVGPDPSLFAIMTGPIGGPCVGGIGFGPGRTDNPCDALHFWSLHPGGANFLFSDGSLRFLRYGVQDLLPELATRDGGEAIDFPD